MNSKIANAERISFADRLNSALVSAGQPTTVSSFMRAYNARADGSAVTSHGARKWLKGEAIPTQEKILILSRWLHVHAAWLRYGDAENTQYVEQSGSGDTLGLEQLVLINDIEGLPQSAQVLVRGFVDILMGAAPQNRSVIRERKERGSAQN